MLNLGLDLIECFRIHYCACAKEGTQPFSPPFSVTSARLSALSKTGHTHSFYHYIYVLAAKNAQIRIAGSQCSLSPGCLYLVKPGVPHDILAGEDYELVIYEIKFSASDKELSTLLLGLPQSLPDPDGRILQIIRALTAEYNNANFQDALPYVKLWELLLTANRIAQTAASLHFPGLKPYDPGQARFSHLVSFITENFPQKITVEQMACIMHMEKGYFSKQFKKQFSMTPMHYLQAVRISRSLNLIEYTELSIAEIAEAVGFLNQNSYIKAFKSLYATTPSEYRKKIRNMIRQKYTREDP